MSRTTQNQKVLDLLRERSLTDNDARDMLGLNRLGARIWDLRHGKLDGVCYKIETVRETHQNGFHARYVLKLAIPRITIDFAPKKESPTLQGKMF